MAIPRWRELHYTDDGCSKYQCLSCKESWESRSTPEYGWKFCPYCGVKWEGGLKCRTSEIPRWQWELIEEPRQSNNIDYVRYNQIQEYINDIRRKNEGKQSIWVIEYRNLNTNTNIMHWYCEQAFTISPYRDQKPAAPPIHRYALQQLREVRDRYDLEREEGVEGILGFKESTGKDLNDLCDRMYPQREWRIRIVSRLEFQKLYSRYISYV